MSDSNGSGTTGAGAPVPPGQPGLWQRYRHSPLWLRIGIPAVIVIVLVGIGLVIANAVSSDSSDTSSANDATDVILVGVAKQLTTTTTTTTTEPATTTTAATTTIPNTTTEPTTTTVAATTTAATTVPATTASTVPATTAAPTTAPTSTTTEAPTTTTSTVPETTTTEATTTTTAPPPTSSIPLPPGSVADSRAAFQTAWNASVDNGVPRITQWTAVPVGGDVASVADLGGNVRVVVASATADGPVSIAILAWLPLSDSSQQAAQNTLYRNAFAVLMKTVNDNVTEAQQTQVAATLGLSPTQPPFDAGTEKDTELAPQRYQLKAVAGEDQAGIVTLISVAEAT